MRIKRGYFALVKDDTPQLTKGEVVKVISYNTPEKETQVTTTLSSVPSKRNPVIMESEDGHRLTKDEFDSSEFIKDDKLTQLKPYHPIRHTLSCLILVGLCVTLGYRISLFL